MTDSKPEALLAWQIRALGLPPPERNYRFCAAHVGTGPGLRDRLARAHLKDFQLDFAWPACKIAIEVDGLVDHRKGKAAHQTIQGALRDRAKWLVAAEMGWRLLPVSQEGVKSGRVVGWLRSELSGAEATSEWFGD